MLYSKILRVAGFLIKLAACIMAVFCVYIIAKDLTLYIDGGYIGFIFSERVSPVCFYSSLLAGFSYLITIVENKRSASFIVGAVIFSVLTLISL